MRVLVDTSVWSLAFRRDGSPEAPEVVCLRRLLEDGDLVFTAGVILQELLQGVRGPRARERLAGRFADMPFLVPDREDHHAAADLHATCRRRGVQAGTIDVLLAQLCVRHDLVLLTTDRDFTHVQKVCPLEVWKP